MEVRGGSYHTVLDARIQELPIFVLEENSYTAWIGPVLGMQLLGLKANAQAQLLARIENIPGKRVFDRKLARDLSSFCARPGFIEIDSVQAVEVFGNLLRRPWLRRP